MPQHAPPARLPLLRASDAVAWSHYLSLPGVIEHASRGHVSERAMALQIARHLPDASDQRQAWDANNLQAVAAILDGCPQRGDDLLARDGGEEFIAALPAAEAHVTISIGVAWQAAHNQPDPQGGGTALRPPGLDRAQHRRAMQVPRPTLHAEAGHGLQKLR